MLGFIFWRAGVSMRRDRILAQRSVRRPDEAAVQVSEATGP
jgi:hypothetical protein